MFNYLKVIGLSTVVSHETYFASGTFRHCSGLSCFAFRTEFYVTQNIKCSFLGGGEVSKLYKFQCSYKKQSSRTSLVTTSEWFPCTRHTLEQLAGETNCKKSLPHDDSLSGCWYGCDLPGKMYILRYAPIFLIIRNFLKGISFLEALAHL